MSQEEEYDQSIRQMYLSILDYLPLVFEDSQTINKRGVTIQEKQMIKDVLNKPTSFAHLNFTDSAAQNKNDGSSGYVMLAMIFKFFL